MKKILYILIVCFLVFPLTVKAELTEFTTYPDLSPDQISKLAIKCWNEQGSLAGVAAEASLMANHVDLRYINAAKYPQNGQGLFDYVADGGWFGSARSEMNAGPKEDMPRDGSVETVVRDVLINGRRTLPGYIVEHSTFSLITHASNNGEKINPQDRNAYVPNVTRILDSATYASTWTFYSFPADNSDPFGYYSEEDRARIGEFHYEFEGGAVSGGGTGSWSNNGIGGPITGMLDDPFTEFPSLTDNKFTCGTIFLQENGDPTVFKETLDGIFKLVKIIAPIIAIALSILDYAKVIANTTSDSFKKANIRTIKRIGIAIAIVFLPYLLDLLFHLFGLYDLSRCGIGG